MSITNRHDFFVSNLEDKLDNITSLTVLQQFDIDKWSEYNFPYCYVELSPEILEYPREDEKNIEGIQEFAIWFGIECNTGDSIRAVFSALVLLVEKQFKNYSMPSLSTSDFSLYIHRTRVTGITPALNHGETKYLFLLTGEIKYNQDWK